MNSKLTAGSRSPQKANDMQSSTQLKLKLKQSINSNKDTPSNKFQPNAISPPGIFNNRGSANKSVSSATTGGGNYPDLTQHPVFDVMLDKYKTVMDKVSTMIDKQNDQEQQFQKMQTDFQELKSLLVNAVGNQNTPDATPTFKASANKRTTAGDGSWSDCANKN